MRPLSELQMLFANAKRAQNNWRKNKDVRCWVCREDGLGPILTAEYWRGLGVPPHAFVCERCMCNRLKVGQLQLKHLEDCPWNLTFVCFIRAIVDESVLDTLLIDSNMYVQ